MSTSHVKQLNVTIRGENGRVFTGGAGAPLLLIHGGWGGAALHWNRVWDSLATRYRVIAPDLPGLGAVEQPALSSIAEYAAWLAALLDKLCVERAAFVGNSFGGSVGWCLAGRQPERCAALVLVNGFPVPQTPRLLKALGQARPFRQLLRRVVAKVSYDPKLVASAFVSSDRVPEELHRLILEEWPLIAPRFADILIAGDGAPPPAVKPLLLWGAADRLPGTSRHHAYKIQQRLPGATLEFLENAGHFPQLEVPEAFARALGEFVT